MHVTVDCNETLWNLLAVVIVIWLVMQVIHMIADIAARWRR